MLTTVLRGLAAIVIGLVAALVIITATDSLSLAIYPVGKSVGLHDPAAFQAFIARLPVGALITMVVGWVFAAYAAAVVALVTGLRKRWTGLATTGLVLAVVVAKLMTMAPPLWMMVASVAGVLAAGWLADRLFAAKKA